MDDEIDDTPRSPSLTPAIWDGYYDKEIHYVHLPSGEKVECWPNAGFMNSMDGSGRMWSPEDRIVVSVQPEEESRIPTISRRNQEARSQRTVVIGGAGHLATAAAYARARGCQVFDSVDPGDPAGDATAKMTAMYVEGSGLRIDRVVTTYANRIGAYTTYAHEAPRGPGSHLLEERKRAKRARKKKRKK